MIGSALSHNTKLKVLNLSANVLGDLGLYYILQPIIKARIYIVEQEAKEQAKVEKAKLEKRLGIEL